MKGNGLRGKTVGEMALDYISRAVKILEGESPKSLSSFAITVSAREDGYMVDIFTFSSSDIPDAIKTQLAEEYCSDQTEKIIFDED